MRSTRRSESPEAELHSIANECVAALRARADPGESQTASFVANLSLQALPTLHGHLEELWKLRSNDNIHYRDWPWCGASNVQ